MVIACVYMSLSGTEILSFRMAKQAYQMVRMDAFLSLPFLPDDKPFAFKRIRRIYSADSFA